MFKIVINLFILLVRKRRVRYSKYLLMNAINTSGLLATRIQNEDMSARWLYISL